MSETFAYQRASSGSNSSIDSAEEDLPLEQNMDVLEEEPRRKKKKKPKFELKASNSISQFFMIWIINLVRISRNQRYSFTDNSDIRHISFILSNSESSKVCGERLDKVWQLELLKRFDGGDNTRKPSLVHAFFKAFGLSYFSLAIWKLIWAFCAWFGTYYCLKNLIIYKESLSTPEPIDRRYGHLYAFGLFLCAFIGSLCYHQLTIQTTRIGIQCRAALMVLIYRKSLKLSYVRGGVGDIVNLISNECNRIAQACVYFHSFWSAGLHCIGY
jgi:hypothetical protein